MSFGLGFKVERLGPRVQAVRVCCISWGKLRAEQFSCFSAWTSLDLSFFWGPSTQLLGFEVRNTMQIFCNYGTWDPSLNPKLVGDLAPLGQHTVPEPVLQVLTPKSQVPGCWVCGLLRASV